MNKAVNNIIGFLIDLKNRKGGYVFSAIMISKLLGFVLSVLVINTITKNEYGLVSYAYNIISFVAPFAGFGIFQSLARYGPLQESQNKKRQLFKFVLGRGILASLLLSCLVVLFAGLITKSLPESYSYLVVVSGLVITHFIFEVIKIHYRIYNINKLFAYLEIGHSVILLLSGTILTYFYGGYGYMIALIISPLIISLYILVRHKMLVNIDKIEYSKDYKKSLWSFGFYTSLGGLTAQLIFSIDILTIAFIIPNEPDKVALYKAASLIPFALLIIPAAVMKTDLVKITQNYQNKAFLKKYMANYMIIFLIISLVLAAGLILFSTYIMSLFGTEYVEASPLINVFAIGLIGALVFRGLFGNVLDAIGWAKTSAYISIVILVLDIILNYFLVGKYGIIGAAYSTSFLLWMAGISTLVAFSIYLRKLK